MKKAIRMYITGTVQGVFFRDFIRKNAEKFNVKGFTRNLDDGRVEVFVEGVIDDVKKMIEVCKQGPRHAQIRNVEVKNERYQGFKEFKVLRL